MDIHEPSLKSIGIQFCRVMILGLAIYSVTNFMLVLQGGLIAGTTFSGRVLLRGGISVREGAYYWDAFQGSLFPSVFTGVLFGWGIFLEGFSRRFLLEGAYFRYVISS